MFCFSSLRFFRLWMNSWFSFFFNINDLKKGCFQAFFSIIDWTGRISFFRYHQILTLFCPSLIVSWENFFQEMKHKVIDRFSNNLLKIRINWILQICNERPSQFLLVYFEKKCTFLLFYFLDFLVNKKSKTEQPRNPLLFICYTEASFASKRSSKMKIHSKNKLEKVCLPKILKKNTSTKSLNSFLCFVFTQFENRTHLLNQENKQVEKDFSVVLE